MGVLRPRARILYMLFSRAAGGCCSSAERDAALNNTEQFRMSCCVSARAPLLYQHREHTRTTACIHAAM